jgi:hypothetical protein
MMFLFHVVQETSEYMEKKCQLSPSGRINLTTTCTLQLIQMSSELEPFLNTFSPCLILIFPYMFVKKTLSENDILCL